MVLSCFELPFLGQRNVMPMGRYVQLSKASTVSCLTMFAGATALSFQSTTSNLSSKAGVRDSPFNFSIMWAKDSNNWLLSSHFLSPFKIVKRIGPKWTDLLPGWLRSRSHGADAIRDGSSLEDVRIHWSMVVLELNSCYSPVAVGNLNSMRILQCEKFLCICVCECVACCYIRTPTNMLPCRRWMTC